VDNSLRGRIVPQEIEEDIAERFLPFLQILLVFSALQLGQPKGRLNPNSSLLVSRSVQ
jgi:hypothetical protein